MRRQPRGCARELRRRARLDRRAGGRGATDGARGGAAEAWTASRVGVDIGGTFTDIVLLGDDGRVLTKEGLVERRRLRPRDRRRLWPSCSRSSALDGGAIDEVLHGTTVASNAILEHKGARTGLITTKGFRDVLEIRNLRMPRLYDITWKKPPPLVERHLRVEVDERMDVKGEVDRPLDQADAERAVRMLLEQGIEAIAVCLLHCLRQSGARAADQGRSIRGWPRICRSRISSEVLPEIKEYERTSTTVINAYVMPIVAALSAAAAARSWTRQGVNGAAADHAVERRADDRRRRPRPRPLHIIESGPAGGVVGAQALARADRHRRTSSPSTWAAPRPRPRSSSTARYSRRSNTRSAAAS